VETIFESVPNFSEGRRQDVIEAISNAAAAAHVLDTDGDVDHNRVVVTVAGSKNRLAVVNVRTFLRAPRPTAGAQSMAAAAQ